MKTKGAFIVLFTVLIGGCVPSLHELYTQETLVYDDAFVGKFQENDNIWEFVGNAENKFYELTIHEEKDVKSEFKAHLVNVQGQLFFDLFPSGELESGEYTKMHVVPVHLFWKVDKTDAGFTLAIVEPEKVADLLEEKPTRVKHEICDDDRVVLTDSPQNLQKFLSEGMKTEGFFGDPEEFKRFPAEKDVSLAP